MLKIFSKYKNLKLFLLISIILLTSIAILVHADSSHLYSLDAPSYFYSLDTSIYYFQLGNGAEIHFSVPMIYFNNFTYTGNDAIDFWNLSTGNPYSPAIGWETANNLVIISLYSISGFNVAEFNVTGLSGSSYLIKVWCGNQGNPRNVYVNNVLTGNYSYVTNETLSIWNKLNSMPDTWAIYWSTSSTTTSTPALSDFQLNYVVNNVSMIYPSDKTPKPLGCGAAMVSDWLASMSISTKLKNYAEGLDTNSKFVNQSTGRAIGNNGTGIISFGGLYVNPVVKYAELDSTPLQDRAPIRFHYNSVSHIYSFQLWNGSTIPGASLPTSIINLGQDMFVIEVYKDASNRSVLLSYGFGWKGTYAAGKYFDTMIYPNLGSYPYGWIIVEWNDTNGDGFVNNPSGGDTYTIVAADPSSLTTAYSEAASNKPQSGSSWVKVSDPLSSSGLVMKASKSSPNGAMLHGPCISTEQGGGSMLGEQYTAFFKLKVSSNLSASDVAYIDVCCNNGSTVLASTRVKASDLASNVWQCYQLNFVVPSSMTNGLEFRVKNFSNGVTDVYIDLIQIMRKKMAD